MRPPGSSAQKAPRQGLQPHSLYRIPGRAFAVILDSIPLTLIYALVWAGITTEYPSGEFGYPLILIGAVTVLVIYHILFESVLGWTPGKLLTDLRVVDGATLGRPSFGQVLVRNLLRPVDGLFGYIVGFIVAESSTYRQRIGDHAAGTLVLDADFEKHIEEAESLERRRQAGARAEQRVCHELGKLAAFDGEYYVWNDLYEEKVGNIDHLVVGPGGLTIVETKSHKGVVEVQGHGPPTVDGKPVERDVLRQVHNQRLALMRRMGIGNADPERMRGFEWLICFAQGELSPDLAPNVRRRLATAREVRGKIRSQPREASSDQVGSMADAVERLYGRGPDHRPSGSKEAQPDGPSSGY